MDGGFIALLQPRLDHDDEQEADRMERRQIADLTRVIRGYKVKPKRLEALGELKDICAPVSALDEHLSTLRMEADERLQRRLTPRLRCSPT